MKSVLVQIACGLILSLGNFLCGVSVTWPSYATNLLASEESPLGYPVSQRSVSLIVSLLMLALAAACAGAGFLADSIGRKNSELLSALVFVLSWALIATAKSVLQIIIGRVVLGLACGIHFTVGFIYVNEISQAFIRGTMAALLIVSFSIACLISYLTGWFCSYDLINYLYLTVSIAFAVLLCILRESPAYLITNGKDKEALSALKFYRGTSKSTAAILEEMEYLMSQRKIDGYNYTEVKADTVEEKKSREENETPTQTTELTAWNTICTSKATQRALVILTSHIILGIFTGASAVQSFAAYFFTMAVPTMSAHLCSVILAVSIIVGCVLSMTVTDLVGRRVLMISSSIVCSLCLGALCTLLRWGFAPAWVIPVLILFYNCAYQAGVSNVPLIQLSESFLPKERGVCSAMVFTLMGITNFTVLALFGSAVSTLGLDGTFFMFFIISLVFCVVAYFTTRETKGISVEEIQAKYEKGWCYWN